ncbi:MAG: carbohydrate kinase family protein [Clostridia bacterium]|nr:carbohydrate kinase family protein [Clostridia bacterium]
MYDVACLGILVADAIAKTVDSIPDGGKLSFVDQISLHTGGCAANTAIDLSKIGIRTTLLGKVGSDGFGDFITGSLKKEGVNTDGLYVKEGINTSASLVLVAGSGERTFLHCVGSNAELTYEDVNFDIIAKSKILFVGGTNLMPKFDGEPCSRVLKRAREMGVYTALDTAWDPTGRWMEIVEPCLPYLDLFIPSYDEARMIAGKDDAEEIADLFLSKGVKLCVIKLGKEGCFIKNRDGEKHKIPTYLKVKAVDTTGAGDSFVAGFLAGLIQGWDLYQCGKFANATGTHCVMAVGASTGIKSMNEILEFMGKYEEE